MAQFEIFENPNKAARSVFPYVIALQSDVSAGKNTVIIAPIAPWAKADADDRAVVPLQIADTAYAVMLHGLAAFPAGKLRRPIGSAPEVRERLPRAIDYLFLGM